MRGQNFRFGIFARSFRVGSVQRSEISARSQSQSVVREIFVPYLHWQPVEAIYGIFADESQIGDKSPSCGEKTAQSCQHPGYFLRNGPRTESIALT